MGMIIAEAPAPPVALAELKAFLRIGTSDEDALLAGLLRAAADMCEAFTGRALLIRAVEEIWPASRAWARLGAAPVAAIEAVALVGADGAATRSPPGTMAIDIDAAGDGWVRLLLGIEPKRVRVLYHAGMAAHANGLPEALRTASSGSPRISSTHRDEDGAAGPAGGGDGFVAAVAPAEARADVRGHDRAGRAPRRSAGTGARAGAGRAARRSAAERRCGRGGGARRAAVRERIAAAHRARFAAEPLIAGVLK